MNFMPTEIAGDIVTLRQVRPEYAPAVWEYTRNNIEYFTKWQNSTWKDENDIRDYFQELNSDTEHRECYYAIFLGDKIIGTINCWDFSPWRMACQLGYDLSPDYSGHGYMTIAVKMLVDALIKAGMVRIKIECATDNVPSMNLAKSTGFVCEGIMKKDVFMKSVMRFCDTAVFAIVNDENADKLIQTRQI